MYQCRVNMKDHQNSQEFRSQMQRNQIDKV
jgi:hypothetical protein